MFLLMISLGFALNVKQVILDENIVLKQDWTFAVKSNASAYKIKKKGRHIQEKDGQAHYFISQKHNQNARSLFRVEQHTGYNFKSYKYTLGSGGRIDAVTVCEKNSRIRLDDEDNILVCQYMDYQSCSHFKGQTAKQAAVKLKQCQDLAQKLAGYFPDDKKYARRTEDAIDQTANALDAMGFDYGKGAFASLVASDDEYRSRTRKDILADNMKHLDYLYHSIHLASEICNTVGDNAPPRQAAPEKASN
tara:strand:- start:2133 stop:2876 length:744 start_codon:yes stop_codon:yes gene_type:complete